MVYACKGTSAVELHVMGQCAPALKANSLLCLLQKQHPEAADSDKNSHDGQSATPTSSRDSLQGTLERKADVKRALLRRPEYDPPARVADGLFIGEHLHTPVHHCVPRCITDATVAAVPGADSLVHLHPAVYASCAPATASAHASTQACDLVPGTGGVGAARDLEKLEALGVTHIVNASPIVPCFHRKRLRYRSICVYDDEQDDIAQHFAAATAFIAKVLIGTSGRCLHMHGRSASSASSHCGRGCAGVSEELKRVSEKLSH
jgi:hypothetical protein